MTNIDEATRAQRENAYYETQELLLDAEYELADENFAGDLYEGVDLRAGLLHYVTTYGGTNTFTYKLQVDLVKYGRLSDRQLRAAGNILRKELKSGVIKAYSKDRRTEPIAVIKEANPIKPGLGEFHKPVIETDDKKSMLDISGIPDGRYAFLNGTDENDLKFFVITTVTKTTYLDRAYRWSKFRTGRELIYPETILVREWSQDAKRLVGYQKPNEGYAGEYIETLIGIMGSPKLWGLVFAQYIGRCAICGKTLTKQRSRDRVIGPECEKKYGMEYWERFNRTQKVADAQAGVSSDDDEEDEEEV